MHMQYKKGFSLISFLIYLLLFSLVTTFTCHIITTLIIPSFFSLRKTQSLIAIHVATDCFIRDVKNRKEGKYTWNVIQPHELIWQVGDHNIGWSFADNRVERREGIYKNGWKEVKTSIVAKGVASAIFAVEKHGNDIIGIELSLTPLYAPQKPITCYVAVKKQENHEKE